MYANPPQSTREILHPADYFEQRFQAAPSTTSLSSRSALSPSSISVMDVAVLAGNADGWKSIADDRTESLLRTEVLAETRGDRGSGTAFFDAYTHTADGWLSPRIDAGNYACLWADRPLMEPHRPERDYARSKKNPRRQFRA